MELELIAQREPEAQLERCPEAEGEPQVGETHEFLTSTQLLPRSRSVSSLLPRRRKKVLATLACLTLVIAASLYIATTSGMGHMPRRAAGEGVVGMKSQTLATRRELQGFDLSLVGKHRALNWVTQSDERPRGLDETHDKEDHDKKEKKDEARESLKAATEQEPFEQRYWESKQCETGGIGYGGFMGPASTTRYWDCAYQHCYGFMKGVPNNMRLCAEPTRFLNISNIKGEPNFFAHPELGMFELDGHLYGTAAVSASLGVGPAENGSPGCGKCFDLKTTWGPAMGKDITVMATNYCPECNAGPSPWGYSYLEWHFDLAIPGGGQGLAPHCGLQYPEVEKEDWLVKSVEQCKVLPQELQYSCELGHQWLSDYPNVMFREVPCPKVLLDRLGCGCQVPLLKQTPKKVCDCLWSLEDDACMEKSDSDCWKACCTPA